MNTDPIYGIIERKKQGTDCTEAESAEVKGWLRNIQLPFEQPTFNDVKTLFPIEYNEFLEEVEVHESLDKFYNDAEPKPERKFYVITCHVANVFTNDANVLTDAEFIEFAKAEGMIYTEAEFIETFNTGVRVISSQKQFLRII
jgi:hypothetical protein